MNLLTVFITYNRLELTKKTLDSYFATINVPHFVVVVDNNSSDGTQEYLRGLRQESKINLLVLNDTNTYPGKATNDGWRLGIERYPEATHLHRSDNDLTYYPDWDKEVQLAFENFPNLGQLGLLNQEQEFNGEENKIEVLSNGTYTLNTFWPSIGGPCILPRQVWEEGNRYDETPWHHFDMPTGQEDVKFSMKLKADGRWFVANLLPKVVWHLGDRMYMKDSEYEDYYRTTFSERGYDFDKWLAEGFKIEELHRD